MFVQVTRLLRIRRLLNRAACAPAELTALVIDLAAEIGVRPPAVRVSTESQSPFVCALGRPILVWPAPGLATLSDAARRAVNVHELAHLARRDHWIGWVELAASCGWWWNPLFWYVRHQLHENAELACDAWVTGLFPQARRDYASALIDLAELDSWKTAIVPALGVGDGSRKLFERRLVMIMGDRVRYRMGTLGFIGIGLLALAALPGCSAGFAADQAEPTDPLPGQIDNGPAPVVIRPGPEVDAFDPLKGPAAEPGSNPAVDELPPAAQAPPKTLGIALDDPAPPDAPAAATLTPVLPPASLAQEHAPASNDDRLKRLEDRLESLLTEIRDLKSSANNQDPKRDPNAQPGPKKASSSTESEYRKAVTGTLSEAKPMIPQPLGTNKLLNTKHRQLVDGKPEAVTLTRATYKLPPGKADEIAAFFKAILTDDIEVRVKGDLLIVTASPDDLTPIAGFMRLVQTRGVEPAKAGAKWTGDTRRPPIATEKFSHRPTEAGGRRRRLRLLWHMGTLTRAAIVASVLSVCPCGATMATMRRSCRFSNLTMPGRSRAVSGCN